MLKKINSSPFLGEVLLGAIFLYAMKLRHASFSFYKGLWCKGTECDVDGYLAMSVQLFNGEWAKLFDYRPTQLLYPLMLSPIHLFHLKERKYVWLLHAALTFGTLVFVYLSAKRLHSKVAGLIAALLIATHSGMIFWFNWMFTEYLYYFLISLFFYLTIRCFQEFSLKKFVGLCLFFILPFSTKPESVAPFFPVFIYGLYKALLFKSITPSKAKIYLGSLLLISGVIFFGSLKFSPAFRTKVFSHIHVAHGFWLSTHTGELLDETEQGLAYDALSKWASDKNFKNLKEGQLAMSYEGVRIISEDPLKHIRHIAKRFVAVLYTWKFALGWDEAKKEREKLYTIFFTLGTLLALIYFGRKKAEFVLVFSSIFCMLFFVACYHLDGDFKVRLPIHIPLSILGTTGWLAYLQVWYELLNTKLIPRKVDI